MINKLNIEIDIEQIKQDTVNAAEKQITEYLNKVSKEAVNANYNLGYYIKEHIQKWIHSNLKNIVIKELESVDIKAKVDLAVERAVLDIVHSQIKNIKL